MRTMYVLYWVVILGGLAALLGRRPARRVRRFLFENGLSLFFLALFLAALVGQSFAGQRAYNAEEVEHGGAPLSWFDYVTLARRSAAR